MATSKYNFFSPKNFLDKFDLVHSSQYKKHQFLNQWENIVGTAVFRHSKIISFKSGILYLHINELMWKNELSLNKHALIKKINNLFPATALKEIIFTYHSFKNNLTQKEKLSLERKEKINFSRKPIEEESLKEEEKKLSPHFSKEVKTSLAKLKLTWLEIKKNPPKDIFPNSSKPLDYVKAQPTNLNFLNYYFPLNSIRSEFLNFDIDE